MDSPGIISLLPAGWILGIVYTVIDAWDDIVKCLTSCNSFTLKAERLLTVAVVFMGAASPSQVVYSHLKNLIDKVLTKYTGSPLMDNSSVAQSMQVVFMFLGVRGLDEIWDYVRHTSLCLRFDNCNEDFLIQISQLKSRWCEKIDPSQLDMDEALPLCDSLINDSPLILLAFVVISLHFAFNFGSDPDFNHHLPSDEMELFTIGKTAVNSVNGDDSSGSHKDEADESHHQSSGSGGHQIIYADCPDCKTTHEIKLPNPIHMECQCKTPSDSEVIERLLPKLKLCKECHKNVKNFVKDSSTAKPHNSNSSTSTSISSKPKKAPGELCDECGQQH